MFDAYDHAVFKNELISSSITECTVWCWNSSRARDFSLLQNVQTSAGATQPPMHWVPGFLP